MVVTPFYAGVLALFYLLLSVRVVSLRQGGISLGDGVARGFFHQCVIANPVRSVDRFFDVPLFEDVVLFVRVMSPDSSQVVGLQFQSDGSSVEFVFVSGGADLIDRIAEPHQFLHVVSDFVCDYIGRRKIATGFVSLCQLAKE